MKFKILILFVLLIFSSYPSYAKDKDISEYDYLKFLGESIEKIKSDYVEHIDQLDNSV